MSKGWARGYEEIPDRPTMLYNMGTENELRRFDFRTFFKNLYRSLDWYMYNPDRMPLRERQAFSRAKLHAIKNGKFYFTDDRLYRN